MGSKVTALVAVLMLAAAAVSVGGSAAGPPGTWTRISEPDGINLDRVGLVRTRDGVLHVAWNRRVSNRVNIFHTAIAPNGSVAGAPVAIAAGWASANYPALVVMADGSLRAFFGGIRSTAPGESNNSLNTATAPASGAAWSLQPGKAAASTVVYASGVGAAVANDGTPVVVWNDSCPNCNAFHFGITPATPDFRYERRGCCAYDAGVGVDAVSGEVAVGWYSNATGNSGIYSQTISPGGPTGEVRYAPGSATEDRSRALSPTGQVGITGRQGAAGIYLAYGTGYPTYTGVVLWRHGATRPTFTIGARTARHVDVASAPEGRLWVVWERGGRIYATRTNRGATLAGRVVSAPAPQGTSSVWRVTGEGSLGPLDVFAHVSTPGSLATWHTQVIPGLILASRGGRRATFIVTDAGDAVAGATVVVGGRRLTTNARGTATTTLRPGRYTARATRAGYVAATLIVRVR